MFTIQPFPINEDYTAPNFSFSFFSQGTINLVGAAKPEKKYAGTLCILCKFFLLDEM